MTVTVTDVNDNAPVFDFGAFDVETVITENYGLTLTDSDMTLFSGLSVIDADESSSFTFDLHENSPSGLFAIDSTNVSETHNYL